MQCRISSTRALVDRGRSAGVPLALLALTACVDSSIPSSPESLIDPSVWNTRPGKVQTFTATDPSDPTATFIWDVPAEVKTLLTSANSVTLVSKTTVGEFFLGAQSSSGASIAGSAEISVVDFSFSFNLALGYEGSAGHQPLGDAAAIPASDAPLPGVPGRIWVAYFNEDTTESFVQLYEPDFATPVPDALFAAEFAAFHGPEVAADALGFAYWIEPVASTQGFRLLRAVAGQQLPEELAGFEGLLSAVQCGRVRDGSDLALGPDGALYFEGVFPGCGDGTDQFEQLVRLSDPFGASPAVELLFDTSAFLQAQLAVDAAGRVLVADNEVKKLWRITPGSTALEELFDFSLPQTQVDLTDVDVDAEGAIYVTAAFQDASGGPTWSSSVSILDTTGEVVLTISEAVVPGLSAPVAFERLLGTSIDSEGNLRVIDDRQTDPDPLGNVKATSNYTIDLDAL